MLKKQIHFVNGADRSVRHIPGIPLRRYPRPENEAKSGKNKAKNKRDKHLSRLSVLFSAGVRKL